MSGEADWDRVLAGQQGPSSPLLFLNKHDLIKGTAMWLQGEISLLQRHMGQCREECGGGMGMKRGKEESRPRRELCFDYEFEVSK